MIAPGPAQEPQLAGFARFKSDVKRLAGIAAKIGAILAIVCHMLPPNYRPICTTLASLCGVGG